MRIVNNADLAVNPTAIAVNQIELHLFNQQRDIVKYCTEHDIAVQAFCPLARSKRMDNPTLVCLDDQ